MTASTLVRNPMDNSVGATLCSRRQRSLSAIFEHGDLKWYASGEAKALVLSRDIYDTQRLEIHCSMRTKILYSIIYLITVSIPVARSISKRKQKNANSHITELLLPMNAATQRFLPRSFRWPI